MGVLVVVIPEGDTRTVLGGADSIREIVSVATADSVPEPFLILK